MLYQKMLIPISFLGSVSKTCPDDYPCVYLFGHFCCKFNVTFYDYPINKTKQSCKEGAKVACPKKPCEDSGNIS